MLIAMDGGGGSTIIIDTDKLRQAARGPVTDALKTIEKSLPEFRTLEAETSDFGDFDAGQDLGRLHSNVQGVFVSVVEGVKTDTNTYEENLNRGAQRYDEADEDAANRSRIISRTLQPGAGSGASGSGAQAAGESVGQDSDSGFQSDQNYDEARAEAGDGLAWPDDGSGETESGGGGESGSESQPSADSGDTDNQPTDGTDF